MIYSIPCFITYIL